MCAAEYGSTSLEVRSFNGEVISKVPSPCSVSEIEHFGGYLLTRCGEHKTRSMTVVNGFCASQYNTIGYVWRFR